MSRLSLLKKLHYETLKEVHYLNWLYHQHDVPEPSGEQLAKLIFLRSELQVSNKQEHRIRKRIHYLTTNK